MADREKNVKYQGMLKKAITIRLKTILIIIGIILVGIILMGASTYFLNIDDGVMNSDDTKNAPAAVYKYTNNLHLSDNEKMQLNKSPKEFWEELNKSGNRITAYLNSAEELSKLMRAQLALGYLDLRNESEIDKDLDWNEINSNIDSTEVQGVVKLKRALSNGKTITMTYVNEEKFQSYIDAYNNASNDSDREKAKNNALKHFTLEEQVSTNTDTSNQDTTNQGKSNQDSSSTNNSSNGASQGEKIVAEALKYVGNPYVYGGNSLTNGIDCSHFVWRILKNSIGYSEGYTTSSDWRTRGQAVADLSQAGAGDVICYSEHVAIYDGNGKIVEAQSKKAGITSNRKAENSKILAIRRFTTDGKVKQGTKITASNNTGSDTGNNSENESGTKTKFIAKVATFSEHEESVTCDPDDPDVKEYHEHTYTMQEQEIDYQSMINQYKLPFNYLWAMLVIGEDKDFVFDLSDLAFNSKIEITVHDNLQKNTDIITDEYTKKTEIETNGNVAVSYKDSNGNTGEESKAEKATDVQKTKYKKVHTTIDISNTLETCVTLADTWNITYTKEYKYSSSTNDSGKSTKKLDDKVGDWANTDSPNLNSQIKSKAESEVASEGKSVSSSKINSSTTKAKHSTVDASTATQNKTESNEYTTTLNNVSDSTSSKNKDKEEISDDTGGTYKYNNNFANILKKNHAAKSSIINASEWLFEILEKNSDTADMVDLTKYLLFKATGIDYGVTSLNLDMFNIEEFNEVSSSGSDQLIRYIHYHEHSSPPPTNAAGTKYIIEDDGKGHPTVGYGVDIKNSGYEKLFIAKGYPTNIGGEVDKDFVDSIEEKELADKTSEVKAATSGLNLTGYQLNALISRAYNCGTAGATGKRNGNTFKQAYKAYWNENSDDYFKKKNSNANFSHQLYTTYMDAPTTSEGETLQGLVKRRKSEWTLFQTGYYDVLKEWYSEASSSTGGGNVPKDGNERLKQLFKGGTPTSKSQMSAYLTTIRVPACDTKGNVRYIKIELHKDIASRVSTCFEEMAKVKFPISDAYSYSWRDMASGTGSRSHHSYGLAIDINSDANGATYTGGVKKNSPYYINQNIVNIWKKQNFFWGGDWKGRFNDPMHFTWTNH